MNKIALLYNPVAGGGTFSGYLDKTIEFLQKAGLQVFPWRIAKNEPLVRTMANMNLDNFHTVVAAGGDGTVHDVVDAMMRLQLQVPLGIFPVGTANDTARNLHIPTDPQKYCQVIVDGHISHVDVGYINQCYFINVASAGFITEISHQVSSKAKHVLGKSAYYFKGAQKLQDIKPMQLNVTVDGRRYQYDAVLFVLLNGRGAGGIPVIIPSAEMDDGVLDLLIVKNETPVQFLSTFTKIVLGKYAGDSAVECLRGRRFQFESVSAVETDLDGEPGPPLPWEAKVIHHGLQIRTPEIEI
jgi:diacylglycerol kinase (ATP)